MAARDAVAPGAAPWRRRAVMAGGAAAAVAWVVGAPHLAGPARPTLTATDLPGLAPFRTLDTAGPLSAGAGLLAGLDPAPQPDARAEAEMAAVRADPCAAVFGRIADDRLPVALFSDVNCPNCRVLSATLDRLDAARPGTLRIVRHQLPLLGQASALAGAAVLAAGLQGGAAALEARLLRTRLVTDLNLVLAIAASAGLDGPRLVADMQRPEIAAALDRARAIARVFGFWATPAAVIGRTAFLGNLPQAELSRLIDAERSALPMDCPRR